MNESILDTTDLEWLRRLAGALVREPHAADDLVQDTLVAEGDSARPAQVPRRAWLAGIARRLAARRHRGEARRRRREHVAARDESLPDSTTLVERAEVAELLVAAARRLDEPFRRTILLRFLEDLSPAEIAERDGVPPDTVRWRTRRGLALLRSDLTARHQRDWSSWCVLLLPLARPSSSAVAAATSGSTSLAAWSLIGMKTTTWVAGIAAAVTLAAGAWWLTQDDAPPVVLDEPELVEAEEMPEVPDASPLVAEESAASVVVPEVEPVVEPVAAAPTSPPQLFGVVVDEDGAPIEGADVYLRTEDDEDDDVAASTTDASGRFAWPIADVEGLGPLDLGAVANGRLRATVADAVARQPADGHRLVLGPGASLAGRVVDPSGMPIDGLTLIAHTADAASIGHVSPSKVSLYAERAQRARPGDPYEDCRATSDAAGGLTFTGLAEGHDVIVRSLDPGWVIDGPTRVTLGAGFVEWTASPRLGVVVRAVDPTGAPVGRVSSNFNIEYTLDDGSSDETGQWVGAGAGAVSLALDETMLPTFEDRRIVALRFYGVLKSGDHRAEWVSPVIEGDPPVGVAVTSVSLDVPLVDPTQTVAAAPLVPVDLIVRRPDGSAVSDIFVAGGDVKIRSPQELAPGHFRVELPAGKIDLRVSERFSSGSLPWWEKRVTIREPGPTHFDIELPQGGEVEIVRPAAWEGAWSVHASYREAGETEWFGSWGYGTDEETLVLKAMLPAEWRFTLTPHDSDESIVHTALVSTATRVRVE